TITGGNADGPEGGEHRFGGGMYNRGRPTIVDCVFKYNSAKESGGGMANLGADDWTLSGCKFIGNRVRNDEGEHATGGGLCNLGSNLIVDNCAFINNFAAGIGPGAANGGGMYNEHCQVTVSRCSFIKNATDGRGGGMSFYATRGTIIKGCIFIGNSAEGYGGGGILCDPASSEVDLTFANCVFIRNRASQGGGMIAWGGIRQTLVNCRFLGNSAEVGGGIYNIYGCSLVLSNCLFSGNSANSGGAIETGGGAKKSDVELMNCTLTKNFGIGSTGGISIDENDSLITMANCILWGNTDSGDSIESAQIRRGKVIINNCCIQGWSGQLGGVGSFEADPLFIDPNGPDGKIGTEDDDFRLSSGSPCINAGDNSTIPADTLDFDGDGDPNELLPYDLDGKPRIQGPTVDIGAYECN
ncbi:MAG: right-handed parallel beta-helix repeat-containing protein, partial [Phycisphaerales bacterium]